MTDRIREAAAEAIDECGDIGRWLLAAALMGAAAFIVVRTVLAP